MKIAVVGSLNVDYIASVRSLPRPGETIPAGALLQRFGGKGANQAVAAARQGASVNFIGCLGDDDPGRAYRARLRSEKINTAGIGSARQQPTGTALIAVDENGENMIIVAAGANGTLTPAAVRSQAKSISSAALLLIQLECPLPAVLEAIHLANRAAVPVVLNPSPLPESFPWHRCRIEHLVVNRGEAKSIFDLDPDTLLSRPAPWRNAITAKNVSSILITRGGSSTLYLDALTCFEVPALKVKPVDTVGAGDAFAGTLTARLAEGVPMRDAIVHANCAGALATLKQGAQEAIPTLQATLRAARKR